MRRHAGVIVAAALCGTAWSAAVAADTAELALNVRPTECPNLLDQRRFEALHAHVTGKGLERIDLITVRMFRPDGVGGSIVPAGAVIEENVGLSDSPPATGCDCATRSAPELRLALTFKSAAVFETLALDEASLKDGVKVTVSGAYADGTAFVASDCIGLLGRGDVNADGTTDVMDFGVMAANFGRAVEPGMDGDLDGDADVDVHDFAELADALSAGG